MAKETKANPEETVGDKPTEENESTLYFFYTQGCGWCKKVMPDVDSIIESGVDIVKLDIADGDNFMSVSRFIPDFKNLSGTADVTLKTRPYPSGTQTSHGSFDVTTSTTKVNTRIRGRQVAVRISSDAVSDKWRYGTMRLDIRPDGMRGS